MNLSLMQSLDSWIISSILFVAMVLSIWVGTVVGKRIARPDSTNDDSNTGRDISSLTALLFFLLAFAFGMSGNRYESRRGVIVEEANDIGTALLRADLYPDVERAAFRRDFKDYLELRIAYFEERTMAKVLTADSMAQVIAAKLWQRATNLAKDPAYLVATQQMIPALNAMIDVATTRKAGELAKVPETIVWMLFGLAITCGFFVGYASAWKAKLDWIVAGGFCLLVSFVVYITLDLDRPRRGFINLKMTNQNIIDLRKNFE